MIMQLRRSDIIKECLNWLGTPWEHQGRSKLGCDCAGFVHMVGVSLGCDTKGLSDKPTYGRDPDSTMKSLLDKHLTKRKMVQRKPGTILFFGFGTHGQHLGIISNSEDTFYHGFEYEKCVVETRLDGRWIKRLCGVYDFNEVID